MCLNKERETNCCQFVWNDTSQRINSRLSGGEKEVLHLLPSSYTFGPVSIQAIVTTSIHWEEYHRCQLLPVILHPFNLTLMEWDPAVLKSNMAWKRHLLQFYARYLAFFCNDFTENLRPCRRFPIYIKPLIKIVSVDTKLCNLFCVAQSTWKCGKSITETLYLWYVVEKQPKGGGFGS